MIYGHFVRQVIIGSGYGGAGFLLHYILNIAILDLYRQCPTIFTLYTCVIVFFFCIYASIKNYFFVFIRLTAD